MVPGTARRGKRKERMDSNKIVVNLRPEVRFAISEACDVDTVGGPEVRDLVMEALATRGWDEGQIRREYALYEAGCIDKGEENVFTGELL